MNINNFGTVSISMKPALLLWELVKAKKRRQSRLGSGVFVCVQRNDFSCCKPRVVGVAAGS